MPHGARTSLAILILSLGLGSASAAPATGSTWTDPPARKPVASAQAPGAPASAAPKVAGPAATTPAAATPAVKAAPAGRSAVATRRAPGRIVAHSPAGPVRRIAAAPRRVHVAARPPRIVRGPRFVAVAPPPMPDRYLREQPYAAGYGPAYADGRLERLRAAEAAGYLVVRSRTVQFPDGRTLRVYRPDDAGEPD